MFKKGKENTTETWECMKGKGEVLLLPALFSEHYSFFASILVDMVPLLIFVWNKWAKFKKCLECWGPNGSGSSCRYLYCYCSAQTSLTPCCQSETAPELNFSPKYLPMEELLFQRELNIDLLSARWNWSDCLLTLSGWKSRLLAHKPTVNSISFFFFLLLHKHTFISQKCVEETHTGESISRR